MHPTLHDKNVTSVYIGKSKAPSDTLKMAYCLFSGRSVTQYQGEITTIIPGNTPDEPRTIFQVRHAFQYHYSFVPTGKQDGEYSDNRGISLFVPTSDLNRFTSQAIHCMNCGREMMYASSLSAYDMSQKKLEPTSTVYCEACNTPWRYMGLVYSYTREEFEKLIALVEL